jgi:hypothetical protein
LAVGAAGLWSPDPVDPVVADVADVADVLAGASASGLAARFSGGAARTMTLASSGFPGFLGRGFLSSLMARLLV